MTGVWMTSCLEAMGWEFWWFLKKAVSWDLNLGEGNPAKSYGMGGAFVGSVSWDSNLGEASPVVGYGMRVCWVSWDLTLGEGKPAGGRLKDDVGAVSIVKNVCLTLFVSKN